MHIMTIIANGNKYEKAVENNTAYIFDEFGNELYRFDSFARDFFEFEDDVNSVIRLKLFKDVVSGYYDDSYVMEKLVNE